MDRSLSSLKKIADGRLAIRVPPVRLGAPELRLNAGARARTKGEHMAFDKKDQSGRIGYLVLYLMGVPIGLLLVMWVLLGNNIFGPG